LNPRIDGKRTHYYEWQQAGFFDTLKAGGAMHQVSSLVSGIYFGSDENKIYFRVDMGISNDEFREGGYEVTIELLEPPRYRISLGAEKATISKRINETEWKTLCSELEFAFLKTLELAIPITLLEFTEKKEIWFRLIGERQGKEIERWPAADVIRFDLPGQKGEPIFWEV
jgi:hypothetical protein